MPLTLSTLTGFAFVFTTIAFMVRLVLFCYDRPDGSNAQRAFHTFGMMTLVGLVIAFAAALSNAFAHLGWIW